MKNKVIYIEGKNINTNSELESLLNSDWTVKSVTAEHVSISTGSLDSSKISGGFVIVLEKLK